MMILLSSCTPRYLCFSHFKSVFISLFWIVQLWRQAQFLPGRASYRFRAGSADYTWTPFGPDFKQSE